MIIIIIYGDESRAAKCICLRKCLGANSDFVSEPTRIWSQSLLGFGLGANTELEPTRI